MHLFLSSKRIFVFRNTFGKTLENHNSFSRHIFHIFRDRKISFTRVGQGHDISWCMGNDVSRVLILRSVKKTSAANYCGLTYPSCARNYRNVASINASDFLSSYIFSDRVHANRIYSRRSNKMHIRIGYLYRCFSNFFL